MKELGRLIVDSKGTERPIYPPDIINPPIEGEEFKRPTITTYEQGLDWNKQSQQHLEEAVSFTQEYAKRKVEPTVGNHILVISLSDIHWGHADVNYDLFDEHIKTIERTPDTYVILGWNLLDAAIPAKFPDGLLWSGQSAQEQVYTFRDLIRRLDEKHKVLAGIGDAGCHEGWTKRAAGWMIYRELFEGTKIPLLLNGGYLEIEVGDQTYRTALFHKTKYWSTLNKTHGGERMLDRATDAEIVFTAHRHLAGTSQSERFNAPFRKDTAVISSGTYKLFDKFARSHWGTDGEMPGQGIMLWTGEHRFQTIHKLETGAEMMNDLAKAKENEEIERARQELAKFRT